jgi:ribosomal protein S18 acetylase RimI-like enzyme
LKYRSDRKSPLGASGSRLLPVEKTGSLKSGPLSGLGQRLIMELNYTLQSEPTPEEQYRIIDPLIAYNEAQIGPRNKKDFAFFAKSETGEIVGGLLGFTHWNHFFISTLYVDQRFRKEGIGRELMARAEALALEQECDAIYLDTFDFQAPGFYEKLGFKVFGKLDDYPPGHQRFYLVKRIRDVQNR